MINYIYAVVGAIAIAYIGTSEITKSSLRADVQELRTQLQASTSNMKLCRTTLEKQNDAIDSYKIDIEDKNEALALWKSQPEKVRYQTIYRDIIKDTNLTGECSDVKSIINSVPSINLNSL